MLTLERTAPDDAAPAAQRLPRITPSHGVLDRRHSDLSFAIDTGGRPMFRVLVARDPALFAAEQASARRTDNFHDSAAQGLQPYDGPPCFYMLPRSVLKALLPAPRLYYTLVAYEDREGTRPVYAQPPATLAGNAPSVAVAADFNVGSLGLMFGTPLERLAGLAGLHASLGWAQAADEMGEDLGADTPAIVGLADEAEDPGEEASEARYVHGYSHGYARAAEYEVGEDLDLAARVDGDADGDADGEDFGLALSRQVDAYQSEGPNRTPVQQDDATQAYAVGAVDAYDDGYSGAATATATAVNGSGSSSGSDYGSQHHPSAYAAEHEDSANPQREAVPEMLPDEEAQPQGAAQGEDPDAANAVEIEGAASAYGYGGDAAPAAEALRQPLDVAACKAILARIMPFESGADGFARVEPDGEFAGRYGSAHPAYGRWHLGLTYGAFPFVQEQGTLGALLAMMQLRDATAFERYFGRAADILVRMTGNSEGPHAWESADGLSPRLQPLDGAPLWQEPWLARFRAAAQHLPFQGAQNELAAKRFIFPLLPALAQMGLDSEQALTLAVDRAVQMGADAALAWLVDACSPLATPAQRQAALDRLSALQPGGLPAAGPWDAASHAAVLGRLRAHPQASPVPLPTRAQMVAAMVRRSEGTPWAERVRRLASAASAERLFQF